MKKLPIITPAACWSDGGGVGPSEGKGGCRRKVKHLTLTPNISINKQVKLRLSGHILLAQSGRKTLENKKTLSESR